LAQPFGYSPFTAPYLKASPAAGYANFVKVTDCSGVSFALERARHLLSQIASDGSHISASIYFDFLSDFIRKPITPTAAGNMGPWLQPRGP
ncbi:MAG: hypothetical protein J4N85_11645, partial [Chloroflexi bacterium]|nr:hypothetical protein [Chloroflexota bacterium]MCI0802627.1 hypothetical protein [Chloroflexota bacterium]